MEILYSRLILQYTMKKLLDFFQNLLCLSKREMLVNRWHFARGLFIVFLSLGCVFRAFPKEASLEEGPWLTGPLLSPQGTVVLYGEILLKSYLYGIVKTGQYDKNWHAVSLTDEYSLVEDNFFSLQLHLMSFFGLTPWCDLNITPQVFYQNSSGQQAAYLGDLTVGLDFQLLEATASPYFPGIKLAVREVFPTGRYQMLSPRKMYTDQTGEGAFATQFALVFYKVFSLCHRHWLSMTASAEYTIPSAVEVLGFTAYGGGFGAHGTVLPGNRLQGIVSFEGTINRHWVLALDSVYIHADRSSFMGEPGISFAGRDADMGRASSEQWSLAPAIEYNWSESMGVIVGSWFSLMGRNSLQFYSGVANFVCKF